MVWKIPNPIVNRAVAIYDGKNTAPAIQFQPGDKVSITAGGCVQTGGVGKTWKRYVNPSGPNSDKLYFGSIDIPGLTNGLRPLRTMGCHYNTQRPDECTIDLPGTVKSASEMFLQVGYADDGYGDNGYYAHDDGTQNQCRNTGNAFLTVTITRQ